MKRAAEWFLVLREIPIERAPELINQLAPSERGEYVESDPENIRAYLYGATISAEEGLWVRSGWAGRG